MASIDISIPHKLGATEATKRIKTLLKSIKKEYLDKVSDVEEKWKDSGGTFSFKTMGFKVFGELEVGDTSAHITGSLPFMASIFKGNIEAIIKKKARELLK